MNDPWLESWLECQRFAGRTVWRSQFWWISRQLGKSERQLGELGWQQANFDPRDTAVSGLQTVEKQQAGLLFDIAETKEQIAGLKTASVEKTTNLQAALQLAEDQASRSETHVMGLLASLESERSREAPLYLIQSIERTIAEDEINLRRARTELHNQQEILAGHQKETLAQLAALLDVLKKLETELHDLDHKKSTHFAKIGQDLADVGIAPLNQPEILPRILALREKSAALQTQITGSLADSTPITVPIRLAAFLIFGLLLFAGAVFVFLGIAIVLRFVLH